MLLQMPSELCNYLDIPDEMGRLEKPITQADIDEFERSQAVELPPAYKEYCLKYGSSILQNEQIFGFQTKVTLRGGKNHAVLN